MTRYVLLTLVAGSICHAADPSETEPAQRQATLPPLVFVVTGESNSGGIGLNSQATPAEREPRPCVQIMNLTNGRFTFEPLQLGVNNLREHVGLEKCYDTCHGFENELANAVQTNAFPGYQQVYLIKTGQGGSTIAQWAGENPGGYWSKFPPRRSRGTAPGSFRPAAVRPRAGWGRRDWILDSWEIRK